MKLQVKKKEFSPKLDAFLCAAHTCNPLSQAEDRHSYLPEYGSSLADGGS